LKIHILTGAVIDADYIEPRQFLEERRLCNARTSARRYKETQRCKGEHCVSTVNM